jgi:hypothetical protein
MKHTLIRRMWQAMLFVGLFTTAWGQPWTLLAQSSGGSVRNARISADEMKVWLTYLASDQLHGRQVFTEGYGLAAQYIASQLGSWGVKPLGPDGTYLQPVRLTGYRVTRNSSVTVEANGQRTTFKHGEHVTFPANAGGKQTLTFDGVEFVGYGQPGDYKGRDVKGKLVVSVPNLAPPAQGAGRGAAPAAPGSAPGPAGSVPAGAAAAGSPADVAVPAAPAGRGGNAGAMAAGAAAAIGFTPPAAGSTPAEEALAQAQQALAQATAAVAQAQQAARGGRGGGRGQGGARGGQAPPDVTSAQRVDATVPPQFTGDDTFFNALFAGSTVAFADVKARAEKGEPIAPVSLRAKVDVEIGHTYEPITQQITHNVVGLVEGSAPQLKETYVVIGAHLDHVGYSQTGAGRGGGTDGCRRRIPAAQEAVTAAGRVVQRPGRGRGTPAGPGPGAGAAGAPALPFEQRDRISNGADDNASGSTALMAIAKAFATGPKPKRSIVFVWHTGEEAGLYGSRYNADFPVVPLDRTQAYLNMDMVGRDDCNNKGDYANTVFVVGADRISTDLHNVIVQTNGAMSTPLTLDYELNDANDPENVYTRSDHYSYALKGVPIAFFTTGLHPDYHRVSDTVDKIQFPKLARIAQLVYQTGFSIANTDRALQRDNKGARTGYGTRAEVLAK